MLKVLGVITARGGSKSVPRKNVRPLCGKPLLRYAAEAALGARHLSRVVLSTEDEEIAELGRRYGVEVPFMRPVELAGDTTPTLPVLQHAVASLEEADDRFDAVCLLQPTNPLRRSEHIDQCIEMLERTGADAVVTVLRVPPEHNPHWVYVEDGGGFLRLATGESQPIPQRQDLPAAYHREGSVYVTRRDVLMDEDSLYGERLLGYELQAETCVNIDDWDDWKRAEKLMTGQA